MAWLPLLQMGFAMMFTLSYIMFPFIFPFFIGNSHPLLWIFAVILAEVHLPLMTKMLPDN